MGLNSTIGQEQLMGKDNSQSGFTLAELMIAMVISGILLAGMVMAFIGQSRSYNAQQEITVLQEDIRASLSMMTSEIRMAGYDPTTVADAKILLANATEFQFSQDITDNAGTGSSDGDTGDANEIIRYKINTEGSLGRATGAGNLQPLAENTEQLAFEYLINLTPETWTQTPTAADLKKIRAVKIVVLARTARKTSSKTDSSTFIPPIDSTPLDWTPATPGKYQRRMMSVVVQCRNIQG